MKKLDKINKKEEKGWLALTEQSLNKVWNNKKDKNVWAKYSK